MKEIQLREAKATLSALVKLKTRAPSFADLLLALPPLDPKDLPKRRPARMVSQRRRK